jgi:epoxyqueuosine reductase
MGVQSGLKAELKTRALAVADMAAVTSAAAPENGERRLRAYIKSGLPGGLGWLAREPQKRADIRLWFPGAQSVLVCAFACGANPPNLSPEELQKLIASRGGRNRALKSNFLKYPDLKIAAYFALHDYHETIKAALSALLADIRAQYPGLEGKVFCDDSPVLEKAYAEKAGLGWTGKNTLLLTPQFGSRILLGGIALNAGLEPDAAPQFAGCGDCEVCINACPGGALSPYRLNPAKCCSYWTTACKDELPEEIAAACANRAAGCDACQDCCPVNAAAHAIDRNLNNALCEGPKSGLALGAAVKA